MQELLAGRIRREVGDVPEAQVDRSFRLFYGRPPDATELSTSVAMIRANGLPSFARALYNTSEFLFVF